MIGVLDGFAWVMVLFCLWACVRAARDPQVPRDGRLGAFVMALICVAALSARIALWWYA